MTNVHVKITIDQSRPTMDPLHPLASLDLGALIRTRVRALASDMPYSTKATALVREVPRVALPASPSSAGWSTAGITEADKKASRFTPR